MRDNTLLMKREQIMNISGLIFQWEGEEVMVQLRLVIVAMGSFFSLFVKLEVIEILQEWTFCS